jgi:hypothetical protein
MYVDVPTKVSAIELMSSPETPKSQILICPSELRSILEGLISVNPSMPLIKLNKPSNAVTSVDDAMDVIEINQALQHCVSDPGDDIDWDGPLPLVYSIQGSLVHELHADADVGIGYECSIERNDVLRMAIMHELKFAENLFPHSRFSIDKHDLRVGEEMMPVFHPQWGHTFFAIFFPVGT